MTVLSSLNTERRACSIHLYIVSHWLVLTAETTATFMVYNGKNNLLVLCYILALVYLLLYVYLYCSPCSFEFMPVFSLKLGPASSPLQAFFTNVLPEGLRFPWTLVCCLPPEIHSVDGLPGQWGCKWDATKGDLALGGPLVQPCLPAREAVGLCRAGKLWRAWWPSSSRDQSQFGIFMAELFPCARGTGWEYWLSLCCHYVPQPWWGRWLCPPLGCLWQEELFQAPERCVLLLCKLIY